MVMEVCWVSMIQVGLDMRLGLYLVDWGAFRGGAQDRNP